MRMNQSNEDSRKLEVTGFWFCEDLNKFLLCPAERRETMEMKKILN